MNNADRSGEAPIAMATAAAPLAPPAAMEVGLAGLAASRSVQCLPHSPRCAPQARHSPPTCRPPREQTEGAVSSALAESRARHGEHPRDPCGALASGSARRPKAPGRPCGGAGALQAVLMGSTAMPGWRAVQCALAAPQAGSGAGGGKQPRRLAVCCRRCNLEQHTQSE